MRLLGFGRPALSPQLKLRLPAANTFVDLVVAGGGPRGQVCVESFGERTFDVDLLTGTKPGSVGVFAYQNAVGKFRFSAKCVSVRDNAAVFEIPRRVETLQVFTGARRRTAVRLDATVPAQWRFAPSGKGSGDFLRGSLTDISRSGASLIVDREVRPGNMVEVRFSVTTAPAPIVLAGEVMRTAKIETSKKYSLGLRFHGVNADEDRAIMEFINKRQAERRNRGLA